MNKFVYILTVLIIILILYNKWQVTLRLSSFSDYSGNNKKVALCFFGLCRTTNYTNTSIEKYIYKALEKLNINYDTYLHTYKINKEYNNQWSGEKNMQINNDNWKLLNPKVHMIEDEDLISNTLDLPKYRTLGDPWNTNFNSLDNVILTLRSIYQVTTLWSNSGITYDAVIYLRPDVLYLKPLKIEYFNMINDHNILLPNFGEFPINDRFAIGTPRVMQIYGERFINAYNYSLIHQLHAETYLNDVLKNNNINIVTIHFRFCRIRMDGSNSEKEFYLEDYQDIN